MLIHDIIDYCDIAYRHYHCNKCTGHNCSHNCKKCLDDIHFHTNQIRTKYDCEKLLYYYICRYSYKYCSEISYALDFIELNKYPYFDILSLGCGGAADLMAFDHMFEDDINIYYHGVDINTYWDDIHSKITELYPNASFATGFDIKSDIPTLSQNSYNVIIIEYLISYLYSHGSTVVERLFDDLIEYVVKNKPQNSPLLIIINDVDSINTGRDVFIKLAHKIKRNGYNISIRKLHFKENSYYSNSERHQSNALLFDCPWNFQQEYCVPLSCESAQLIIEID